MNSSTEAKRTGRFSAARRQNGAALFIALMILIVLSLLAVSAGQVTALQERMASAYWTDVRTFEAAEAVVRETERRITAGAARRENPPGFEDPCAVATDAEDPGRAFSGAWTPTPTGFQLAYENISRGSNSRGGGNQGSLAAGQLVDSIGNCSTFRVTVIRVDDPLSPSARAIVQSTYIQ